MKDVSRRAKNQTENCLTPREDLPFHDDGSLPDSAIQSDFSNGSAPYLEKSPSSGGAVSYERKSLQEWTDDHSFPFTGFPSTNSELDWSEEQSTSFSDTRECTDKCDIKDFVPQPNIERDPTNLEEGDVCWKNVSTWCTVSPGLSCCNLSNNDADTQLSKFPGGAYQSDGVVRELQGAKHLDWNFTHEALSPITEGQGLEEFECYESDNGIADVESDDSEALWSPSSEDAPLALRPDFVPKLDLSWVFEDENRKQKRSEKRATVAQNHAEKGPKVNTPLCAKSLKTSASPGTRKVVESRQVKDKADYLFSKHKSLQYESTDVTRHHRRNCSVDQPPAHEPRLQHGRDNIVNLDVSACTRVNAQMKLLPETLERTVCLSETRKNGDLFQQQSRRSLNAKRWKENVNSESYIDTTTSECRSRHSAQVTNSKAKCFSWPSGSNIEDYEQSEQAGSHEELPDSGLYASDTNHQVLSDQVSCSSYPQVLLLTKYYVIDETHPQLNEIRKCCRVSQDEQETATCTNHQLHTMLEANSCDSGKHRLSYDPQNADLHFVPGRHGTSDTELNLDTKSESKLAQFIERNAETSDRERNEELEEENDGQYMTTNEPESDELYDVEAAVVRRGRKMTLARLVCFSIGCQSACCQGTRCQPYFCDWKCDIKCFR